MAITVRSLLRSPGFTLAAVVTLALGIGANATMFSVVNSVLLRPLPGYQTGRVVNICDTARGGCNFLDADLYLRLRETLHSFDPIAANQFCRMDLTSHGDPEQITTPCATANWFELQRAAAMLGRTFLPDEDQHGRNHVVVVDYEFWRRRFGGDRNIIGGKVVLDNEPWTIVGVMPPGFLPLGLAPAPIYAPYVVRDNPHGLNVTARLKPGVSMAAAEAELSAAARHLAEENPNWRQVRLHARPVLEQITSQQRPMLLLLLGAAMFVLLIACANVANLLLARGTARQHEIDIRIALGATRGDILRFVLREALAVALAGSILAVALAYGGLHVLAPLTARLPRADELAIDWRVLAAALALGCGSAILVGLFPAIRPMRPRGARATAKPQTFLLTAEVALAFVLLTGAGLLLRTLEAMRATDLGYRPQHVLTSFLTLPASADGTRTAGAALFARIRARVQALPGVNAVATASAIPMFGVQISLDVHAEGAPETRHEHQAALAVVSDDYFRVIGIPLRTGRGFTALDRDGSPRVLVVSESIASRYFGGKPIGKRILLPELLFNVDGGKEVAPEIVGVAGNVCRNSMEDCQAEHIYLPESQNALRLANLLVRTEGDPLAMVHAIRHAVAHEAPSIPLDDPQTLESRTAYLTDEPRRVMWILGVFAGLAAVLAAAGIYGVSAYLAARRSREIGIRLALGAGFTDIARLVYRQVLAPSAAGIVGGMAAAAWLTRLLHSLLFGVSANDGVTLVSSAAALLAIALFAAAAPAVRAASADPASILRRD